jgi:hypothetical protein
MRNRFSYVVALIGRSLMKRFQLSICSINYFGEKLGENHLSWHLGQRTAVNEMVGTKSV